MTGESVLITFAPHQLAPAEIDPAQQDLLWWEQPLSLGPDSIIWVGAASRSWEEVGNRVLRSAGVDDATPEDIRSTYLEIVNQGLSGVASAVSAQAHKEVSCLEGRAAPSFRVAWRGRFTPSRSRSASEPFRCWRSLPLPSPIFPTVALSPMPNPLPPSAHRSLVKPLQQALPAVVDLLLDVELPVGLGRAS